MIATPLPWEVTDTTIIACGLLLPKQQAAAAIQASQHIAEYSPVKFTLDPSTHPPYVRLYETVMPHQNIEVAYHRMLELADTMVQFHMDWGEIEQAEHFTILWGKVNEPLQVFHKAVLIAINQLREGNYKQKYLQQQGTFTGLAQESFEKWGSPWAEPYVPHVVIAKRNKTAGTIRYHRPLEWQFEHCLFPGLIIGTKAPDGTFTHFKEFAFKS